MSDTTQGCAIAAPVQQQGVVIPNAARPMMPIPAFRVRNRKILDLISYYPLAILRSYPGVGNRRYGGCYKKDMKIEAKKNKFNLNKKRPEKSTIAEGVPDKSSGDISQLKLPKIKIPKIKLSSIAFPKIKLPGLKLPKLKGKSSVYIIALLIAIPALVIIVWLGMNLRRHPVPKPLFTESNLPPAPAEDSNGYAYIYDNQIFNEYVQKDICDINLFRNAASIELFLDKTRDEYTFAKTLSERDDVKKMMGLYRDSIKKPLFADMVKPDASDSQKIRIYIALHNSITATLITRMQEKKYNAAFTLMKGQLNLNIQYVKSARSMTNYATSLPTYEKSLNILKSMLNQYAGDKKKENAVVATCREIADMMRTFNPQNVPLPQIVVFEYILLWKQTFDPAIQHPEAPAYQGMKNKALVFFDRGLTQQLLDERWKKIYECAKNPTDNNLNEVKKIQEQRYSDKRFWWFHNAVGKKYLDTIAIPIYQIFQESKNWTTIINQKQGEIITIIDSIKEVTKPVKKIEKGRKQNKKPMKNKIIRKPAA
jgi:hypothetical protein